MSIVRTDGPDGLTLAGQYSGSFYQNIADDIELNSDFSFVVWFRSPDTSGQEQRLFTVRGPTAAEDFYLEIAGNNIYSYPGSGGIFGPSFANTDWHMAAITRDNGIYLLWVDGVLVDTSLTPDTTVWGGEAIFVGYTQPGVFLISDIYDFRMYLKRMDTATIAFAYDDMINNGGGETLPNV
jgi:hypothetical protein